MNKKEFPELTEMYRNMCHLYIEEVKKEDELDMKLRLGSEIIDMVRMMDIDHLERVKKYIKNL